MIIYALTILVSAFLLFQVEPVIAKIILPWFGGSAAVWTVCLLFFQMVLLLGYLYAHALARYLKPRMQMVVHLGLLAVSLATLPIFPASRWKPSPTADPTTGILGLLAITVGLPYFLLSTTGPLVQAWYARRFKGAKPYRLYALSNAGSMFALLSYPVLFEPVFTTHQQAGSWSWAYVAFVVLCGCTAWASANAPLLEAEQIDPLGTDPAGTDGTIRAAREQEQGLGTVSSVPTARQYILWMALPACASVLLLAITNHLTQNVAAIPFLWVLPLSIYLLSFILCFEGSGWYWRNPYLQLLAVALGCMAYAGGADLTGNLEIKALVPLYCLGLFTCCMVCHGELAMMKPHPRYLTHFFLMIAAGGAMGGILVALVAPKVFSGFYEMPLALVACGALIVIVLKQDPGLSWFRKWWQPAPAVSLLLVAALGVYVGMQIHSSRKGSRVLERNFYGGLRVRDSGPAIQLDATRSLTNGTINHGEQFLNPARRDWPTTYYGPNTGIGIAIRSKQKTGAIRVGVIGLGTGTIAAYGRLGDYFRYYEINPLVLKLATSEFTYLNDCKARHDVAMGDARLSLEREAPENLDVLAVDAFTSDSIPVHLLTKQAMELYFRHLRQGGILAVHISNRYLNLEPVVDEEAEATGHIDRLVDTTDDDDMDVFGATWVLVTAPSPGFDREITQNSQKIDRGKRIRLWTDDYSNLFQILK